MNRSAPFELSIMAPHQFTSYGTFPCATNWIVLDNDNDNDSEEIASEDDADNLT